MFGKITHYSKGWMLAILLACTAATAAAKQPLWHFAAQDSIWSSIVIDNDIAFFGSDDGYIYALDTKKQQLQWKFETTGKVRSNAAINSKYVYLSSDDGYLYALDKTTGKMAWQFDLQDGDVARILPKNAPPWAFDYAKSSPRLVDNHLYIGSADGHLYAINATTGQQLWRYKTGGIIRSTPAFHNGLIFVGSWDGHVYALEQKSGALKWRFTTDATVTSNPVIIQDTLIIGSRDTYIYALDPTTGDKKWQYRFIDGSWVESSAIAAHQESAFYIGSSDSKKVLKFDLTSGQVLWSRHTSGWTWATPLLNDGVVYIGSTGASQYWTPVRPGFTAFSADKGEPLWNYQPSIGKHYVHGGVFGTPAVANDKLYVPDLDGKLYVYKI